MCRKGRHSSKKTSERVGSLLTARIEKGGGKPQRLLLNSACLRWWSTTLQMPGEKAPRASVLQTAWSLCSAAVAARWHGAPSTPPPRTSHRSSLCTLCFPTQCKPLRVQLMATSQVGSARASTEMLLSWSPCACRRLGSISKDLLIAQAREMLFLFLNYVHF